MEYLVKIDYKARILKLKQRYFEDYCSDDQYAISIKEDTMYMCLHSPKTTKETRSNTLNFITRWTICTSLWKNTSGSRKKKLKKRWKVFNWEIAKYGRIWYDEDVLDLRSVEIEFPAIFFNDNLTSKETPSCEPTAPEKVTATDLFYLRSIDQGAAHVTYLLAKYLFRYAEGEGGKSGARLSGCHFIRRLAHHLGLVSDDGLRGLSVVAYELPLIDMAATTSSSCGRTMPQRLGRLEEEIQGIRRDVRFLCRRVESLMTNQSRVSTWMISCMMRLMEAGGQTYQTFDGTFRGSSPAIFDRCTR
uniref:Uncharacterized protein n=1 Tax=Tanacetum cinerariifolium TaxID=118510 RepID=A0A6L2P377_TANCI|nr:hypothetical protein [Tanacetum cinerariifolium]